MSSFTDPLILEALPSEINGQGEFATWIAFHYDVGHLGSGDRITVPAGFRTDLVTLPWYLRPFIAIGGRAAKPALLHDWLLSTGDPRAHDIFDEALAVAGVPPLKRKAMVAAVRFWAWIKPLRDLMN